MSRAAGAGVRRDQGPARPGGVRPDASPSSPTGRAGWRRGSTRPALARLVAEQGPGDDARREQRPVGVRGGQRQAPPRAVGRRLDRRRGRPGQAGRRRHLRRRPDRRREPLRRPGRRSRPRTPRRPASPSSSSTSGHPSRRTTPPARTTSSSRRSASTARYVPPGGTFSLNGDPRRTHRGQGVCRRHRHHRRPADPWHRRRHQPGLDGRLQPRLLRRGGLPRVQPARVLHPALPRGPRGHASTGPRIDNKWKNDTPYGMLLQTWVEGGNVHGRVWSTKTWDIGSVKGPRRNVVPPKTIRNDSLKCYPQQANPGFDVTVTRQWRRPGSSALVRSEPVTTHYVPRTTSSARTREPLRPDAGGPVATGQAASGQADGRAR